MHLTYWCNLARYWLRTACGWHDSVETCRRSVIICEIIVYLLVTVQNNKRCMAQRIKINAAGCFRYAISLVRWSPIVERCMSVRSDRNSKISAAWIITQPKIFYFMIKRKSCWTGRFCTPPGRDSAYCRVTCAPAECHFMIFVKISVNSQEQRYAAGRRIADSSVARHYTNGNFDRSNSVLFCNNVIIYSVNKYNIYW